MRKGKLTEKQQRFIDFYVITGNATEAARRAGYSEKTAYSIGGENLKKPEIQEAIRARLDEMQSDRITTARGVLEFLTAAMRGEIQEEVTVMEGKGPGKTEARKLSVQISAAERLKAAGMLMKRYGLAMSDIEQEERRARIESMKASAEDKGGGENVVIIEGEYALEE